MSARGRVIISIKHSKCRASLGSKFTHSLLTNLRRILLFCLKQKYLTYFFPVNTKKKSNFLQTFFPHFHFTNDCHFNCEQQQ